MRKLLYLSIILAMLFLAVPLVQAQAPAKYETQVNVTNVADVNGAITLRFFKRDGTELKPITRPIEAYETIYFTSFQDISNFDGSMVIESDVPLASMGMLISKNSAGNATGYAGYIGVPGGSDTVYLPLLMNSNYGYSTFFYIQNTTDTPISATVTYSNGKVTQIPNIEPSASHKIDNRGEAGLPKHFSAVVTASGAVAVAVVEYNDGTGNQLYSYNGFESGDTLPIFPMINENNYGYWTSANIQNTGTKSTTITMTYTPTEAGSSCTETITIPAGEKRDFGTYAFAFPLDWAPYTVASTCKNGERFIGSGTVTANSANQPLVGIVNQINETNDPNKGAALMSQSAALASDTIVFPFVQQWVGPWSWWTSMTVINVSGSTIAKNDIVCSVKCTASGGSPVDITMKNPEALANNAGWLHQFYWDRAPIPEGFLGGAICKSTSGQSIVGTLNILAHNAGIQVDSLAVYEGISQ
ncbi:MAG: hypothetical protein GX142_03345 [Chloroflexi bacterium]|nr:hypothetical protein [Chloroflexota bacterium]